MKGRDPTNLIQKYERLITFIRQASLESFWSRELGTILSKMVTRAIEELGLEYWFPPLWPYPLKDEVGMVLVCVTLRISLRKGIYGGHLHWGRMSKVPTAWSNIYGYGVLGMRDTIYARDRENFTEIACPTRGLLFEKLLWVRNCVWD